MDFSVVGHRLLANIESRSGLPIECRSITAYDDVREEVTSYSHAFAEDDPADGGTGLLKHAAALAEDR